MITSSHLLAILLVASSISFPLTAASGQFSGATGQLQQNTQEQTALKEYTSQHFGVSFKYPTSYSFDNYSQYDQTIRDMTSNMIGYDVIGTVCPTDMIIPSLGEGEGTCSESQVRTPLIEQTEETPRTISMLYVPDLATKIREERGSSSSIGSGSSITVPMQRTLTPKDAFAWYISALLDKDDPDTEFVDESRSIKQLVSTKNFTVPITKVDTGEVVGQAPASLVEYTYNLNERAGILRILPDVRAYQVFILQQDNEKSNAITFAEEARADLMQTGKVPPLLQAVLDSFRLVVPLTEATTPLTATPAQQQKPQSGGAATGAAATGGGTSVSIVSGSSSLTDTAFQPNPVQVSIGDTVTWTNDDTQPHTIVSGSNGIPDGKFDSSPNFNPLLSPGQTFSHTFTQAGEYPYYCALHPNMVGTVSVS